MHDDDEHDRQDEPEELVGRRASSRTDAFARALGDAWVTEGDGIYHYLPETSSLKVPAPAAGERPAAGREDPTDEDLTDALDPGRRGAHPGDEVPTRERIDADEGPSRERKRSLWKRR